MRNKFLSIFLATLMIFGGSFSAFAVDPIVLDYYGPIEYKGAQDTSTVMPIINKWLDDNNYEPFAWMSEKIENQGTPDDYINFTPPSGDTTLYTLHYNKAIPDVIWNEGTNSYDIVPSDPPRKLEYFIIKSGKVFYVMILPEPLEVDESIYIQLPTDISHAYVGSYETTELYSIITGYKYDADSDSSEHIQGVSFDFEIRDEERNLVAIAFSDPNTGEMYFTMLDDQGDPILDLTDKLSLDLPEGTFYIEEVNIPEDYEFVRFEVRDSLSNILTSGDEEPIIEFLSEDGLVVSFMFYNRMKDSTINAFKFDADEEGQVPIDGVVFNFEIWEDKVEGEKVAVGRSDDNGDVWFYDEWPTLELGTKNLVLPFGDYIIKEVELPVDYEFVSFAMYNGLILLDSSDPGDDPEFPFSAGVVDTFRFEFYNRIKDSIITGIKLDENGEPFDDIIFDFEIRNNLGGLVATAKSDGTNGELLFLPEPVGEATPVSTLVLPYGIYTIKELDLTGYDFVKAQLIVDGETPIDFLTPTVPFSAGDAETIHFIYNNVKEVEYKDETAYAIYGDDGGGTLDSIRGNKNWGWYINAPTLGEGETAFYNIYAGAAKNDIFKGTRVGQVEVGIENGYYVTTFHLIDIVVLGEVHFGSYVNDTDIPKAPGQYSQTILAADAKFIVIHMVVWIPQ